MNAAQYIRAALRWVAGASSIGAVLGGAYGLVKEQPFATAFIWLATLTYIAILATWASVETNCANADRIIAAMPRPRTLVRATIEEMEEQAARDAGLPQIADGQRTR